MILALDVGNSQIYGGVFREDKLIFQFRKNTQNSNSSDEIGIFLRSVLRENSIDPKQIQKMAVCSVVPDAVHSLRGACVKYFGMQPFMLQAGAKTGLKIRYRNPVEVGADRIADAIGATVLYPNQNVIIADLGTAITLSVVTKEKDYLGGLILPGLRISMEALESRTAKLPSVEIVRTQDVIARSTVESIQSGLYLGTLYALQGLVREIQQKHFPKEPARVVGTGGFSRLYEEEKLFDALVAELVLLGLHQALRMNT